MKKLKRKAYEKHLEPMQLELVAMARWLAHTGKRVLVLLAGRDTAGKGGAIKAISEHVNPRQCHVVPLPKHNDRQPPPCYFHRHVPHPPPPRQPLLFYPRWPPPPGPD